MAIGSIYRPIYEVAREIGVDVDALLAEFDLTPGLLFARETRLTPDQGRALGRALMRAMPPGFERSELGLRAAERFVSEDADLLGYIMSHSAHPFDAAGALVKHARLIGDSADFRIVSADGRVTLTLALAGGKQFLPEAADFAVGASFRLLRDCSLGSTRPVEVQLPRSNPRNLRNFERFFGAPVVFEAAAGALVYEHACMLAPFSQSDRRLVELLSQHAAAVVQGLPPLGAWQERVRAFISEGLLRGDYALERVAWRCGVGERTLRRRLAEAGTSYRELVDDVRKERALVWLDREGSVSLVAQRLGFSDATAFARAFRRWTGVPPHEYVRTRRA